MRLSLAVIFAAAAISVASYPLSPHEQSGQQVVGHHRRQDPAQPPPQPAQPPPQPPQQLSQQLPSQQSPPQQLQQPPPQQLQQPPPQQLQQPPPQQLQQPPPQQLQQPPAQQPQNQPPSDHDHFEHVEHPGGNPNNIDIMRQDTFNDPSKGIHNNVVSHVTMENNNIRGGSSNNAVHGQTGAISNGKNNVIMPHGSVNRSGGAVAGNPTNVVFVPGNTQPPQPGH